MSCGNRWPVSRLLDVALFSDTSAKGASVPDLGPLAWVMDEVRLSLAEALTALLAFAQDNEKARATDLAQVDDGALRLARQQLHQAAGALEMVNLQPVATTLRALDAVVQRWQQKPQVASSDAATSLTQGVWAVQDFLTRLLQQKPLPALALFPTYEAWQRLAAAERCHPADLWVPPARLTLEPPPGKAYQPSPQARAHLDRLVLPVVKQLHAPSATTLAQLAAGLSRGAGAGEMRQFWLLAAAYFEAVAQGLLPSDLYVKRVASRVLLQYAQWQSGSTQGLAALMHDLLFFANQAAAPAHSGADAAALSNLQTVRQAYGWNGEATWAYDQARLGTFDPAELDALRQAARQAQKTWAVWTEGDATAQSAAIQNIGHLAGVLRAFAPQALPFAQALQAVADALVAGPASQAPHHGLALEMANSLLMLQAETDGYDPTDPEQRDHWLHLAQRLQHALAGEPVPAPEAWMIERYQRTNQRETLEQLVGQLQSALKEVELALDARFRNPLAAVDENQLMRRLTEIRGVLQMLDVPTGVAALLAVQTAVQAWLEHAAPGEAPAWADNLSALGWLLETLRRQPERARTAFVFEQGVLREHVAPVDLAAPVVDGVKTLGTAAYPSQLPATAVLAVDSNPATVVASEPDADADDDGDAEMLQIFLEEAQEVLDNARRAWLAVQKTPADLAQLTHLRRAFHTLKGSARMVGLTALGEAAWAMEQLLNTWLADQREASADLLILSDQALQRLNAWVGLLAQNAAAVDESAQFRAAADAMRLEGRLQSLDPVKVVGPLQIDLELYNVFIDESEGWTQRLSTGLAAWALAPSPPSTEQLAALAHSLAGGAATVGHSGLSQLARALEHAFDRMLAAAPFNVSPNDVPTCLQAGDAITALLHQFAAGILKEPDPQLLDALAAIPGPGQASVPEVHALPGSLDEPLNEPLPEAVVPTPPASAPAEPQTDAVDRVDLDLFPVFEDEVQELLPRLSAAMRQWSGHPQHTDARAEVLRNLHTLKGSARLAGAMRLGDMAHRLEADVLHLPEGSGDNAPILQALDAWVDRFEALCQLYRTPQSAETSLPAVEIQRPEGPPSGDVSATLVTQTLPKEATKAAQSSAPVHKAVLPDPAPQAEPTPNMGTVRVRADLLDQIMTQTGDVMITRARLETDVRGLRLSFKDMSGNLERLRQQLRDLELQTETQMQSRLAQSRDADATFDPLEFDRYTRVQELTRLLAESVNDVATVQRNLQRAVDSAEGGLAAQARQTRELQRDLLRTRLVPFDAVAERLHRVVRQAAQTLGKEAILELQGTQVEMDRGVLDRLVPVLEHLLRNAVAHGIEPPQQRVAQGKPASGRITLGLTQRGNDMAIALADDGAGLALERIQQRAQALGLWPPGQALDAERAAQIIFAPGLTTASEVTELAGRGIGLDAVRNDVLGVGGRIICKALPEGGTAFEMVVPLSTAVTQVVMLRVGDFTFGVPAPWVSTVRRAHAPELTAAYVSGQWREAGDLMPFYWGGALLELSAESQDPLARQAKTWPVLVFKSAGQQVAWHVDEVLGHQEVVVKPLGPQLAQMPGLSGAAVLASGAVALIYNPVALASIYGLTARAWARQQRDAVTQGGQASNSQPHKGADAPLVLVVDDSITVRRVTQRLLQREGFRVALAADGFQALDRLREEMPAVVLSDIEMPRMDGFELVRLLRAEPRWADLPVVMITSRTADKHRDHARVLGVDHYLGKPYDEAELVGLINGFVRLMG